MNIPARYCTGYLGDFGTATPDGPMDFAGWFEAFLAAAGTPSMPAQQHPANRPRAHRPRPGRRGRRDQHLVRRIDPDLLQGLDRRSGRRFSSSTRDAAIVA